MTKELRSHNHPKILSPAGAAIKLLTKLFAEDPDWRHTWVANIAMVIYDNWPKRSRKVDKANFCAKRIMDHLFKEHK